MKTLNLFFVMMLGCLAVSAQLNDPSPDLRFTVTKADAIEYAPGFDSSWASQLQNMLDFVTENTSCIGASVSVFSPGEGMWTGVSGISHLGVPITPDMRFGIGSNTKLFIAVAILKLQEQGKLSLDDQVGDWLPAYPNIDPTATVRQLLSHESGYWDFWNDAPSFMEKIWPDTARFWNINDILASIGPPHFSPGNGYSYCNTNYLLAGKIIEAATGKSWVQNLHELIFEPLSLDSTFVGAYEPANGPVAAEWDYFNNHVIVNSPMTAEYSQVHAAGGILSTSSEMVQWYNALFNSPFLSTSSLQSLLDFDPLTLYSLGLWAVDFGSGYYSHSGGMLGYSSLMAYDVKRKSIICLLYNDRYSWEDRVDPMMYVFIENYPKKKDDAGIGRIIQPWEHHCEDIIIPVIELINYGKLPLTSVSFEFIIDDSAPYFSDWDGLLNPGDTERVSLPGRTIPEGLHHFRCNTLLPNGKSDGSCDNDTAESYFYVSRLAPTINSVYEGFDGNGFPQEGWTLNYSTVINWGETSLVRCSGTGSAVVNNFDGSGIEGQYYDLQLPKINVADLAVTDLGFDYSYAAYPSAFGDSLKVSVSTDCGITWQHVFEKGGVSMVTAGYTTNMYYPTNPGQWKHETVSLDGFEGEILIRFRARNGRGNNLFIDNISVGIVGIEDYDRIDPKLTLACYPNPTPGKIQFSIHSTEGGYMKLELFNSLGQEIDVLLNSVVEPGERIIYWDPETLPAGIYLYRLTVNNLEMTTKTGKIIKH